MCHPGSKRLGEAGPAVKTTHSLSQELIYSWETQLIHTSMRCHLLRPVLAQSLPNRSHFSRPSYWKSSGDKPHPSIAGIQCHGPDSGSEVCSGKEVWLDMLPFPYLASGFSSTEPGWMTNITKEIVMKCVSEMLQAQNKSWDSILVQSPMDKVRSHKTLSSSCFRC